MTTGRKSGALLVFAFLFGFVSGALTLNLLGLQASTKDHKRFQKGGPPMFTAESVLRHLREELNLTDEQSEKVGKVLEAGFERNRQLFQASIPEYEKVRRNMEAEVIKLLNPDQQARYREMIAAFDKMSRRWTPPHGDKPGNGKPPQP